MGNNPILEWEECEVYGVRRKWWKEGGNGGGKEFAFLVSSLSS